MFMKNVFVFSLMLFSQCLFGLYGEVNSDTTQAKANSAASISMTESKAEFIPPKGWQYADNKNAANVKIVVVGKAKGLFPPSINLATEPYSGTLKEYLKIVKGINDAQGDVWKDLGMISTQVGKGSLSQVDVRTEYGYVRMMHLILLKNGIIYIMTASSLRDEFSEYYKDFFAAMRSLKITK